MLLEICQKGLTPDHSLSYFESLLHQVQLDQIFSAQKNMSPLHVACSYGHLEITKTFVNLIDAEGWTPLHCACAEGHLPILKVLGQSGPIEFHSELFEFGVKDGPVDLEARTFDGETAADVALEEKADQVKQCLKGILILTFNFLF
jgi:ankyrin repeat protein